MQQLRNSFKYLLAAAAAVLVLTLVAGPGRVAAQEAKTAVPVASSAAAEPAKTGAVEAKAEGAEGKTEAANSQEEQEHGFLVNGAIVKWMSGVTGWSRDLTAKVFLWLNFAILFFGVAIPIGRKLPTIFRKRGETLSKSLEEARKATADANTRLSAVEAKLAGLDAEIAKFRTQVEEESKADEQRIKSSIEEEKTRIVASAEQELNVAAAQATRNLRSFAADLAIAQATAQLKLTPEADKALIAEFVANAAEGGKN
jgi:F-type H+-transporting ATPase subunit b